MKFLNSSLKTILLGALLIFILAPCTKVLAARLAGSSESVTTAPAPEQTPVTKKAATPDSHRQDKTVPEEAKKIMTVTPAAAQENKTVPAGEKDVVPPENNPAVPAAAGKKEPAALTPQLPAVEKVDAPQPIVDKSKKTAAAPVKKPAAEKYVTIDFDNVDIGVFVKFVSELTGRNFIIDDKVRGKVTIISPKKIPVSDVYKVFLSVLEVNGFATVAAGDMVKIIPAVMARERSVETRLKKEVTDPEDRIVTQIISMEHANPDEIKRVLDPIIPKTSSVLSYPPAGLLVITDYLSNIKRLQEIVTSLDVAGAGDQIAYVPLKNSSATEVTKILLMIFQQRRPTATPVRIVADSRTNSIIILASNSDTDNVRRLIALMDKEVPRGESNIQVYRLQNSNAEDLAKVLTAITKDKAARDAQKGATTAVAATTQVVADKATNTLVIMAEREDYKMLEGIIKKLDVPRPMVYIEALIMEVNANKSFNLGVEWRGLKDTGSLSDLDSGRTAAFIGSGGAGSTANPGAYNIIPGVPAAGSALAFPGGFSMGILGAGITIGGVLFPNIGAVIQAYKTDRDVSILSTPQIMTLDNEEAEINVGSNVPYITRQDSTATSGLVPVNYNTYEYKDVGVILNVTPHINEENYVRLKISQQVTKVTSDAISTTPTTLKRTAKTTVVVKDKETIVIGGLVGDSTTEGEYKVPLLGDIPILGWLFKTKSNSREKTNLYVFLTPYIVRTEKDAQKIYNEKRETMGNVVEGVIKLYEKKQEQKPVVESQPAEIKTPDRK